MPDKKYMGFTAKTTPEGLTQLNQLRVDKKLNWNQLVITAINSYYKVNIPIPVKEVKPKVEKPAKVAKPKAEKTAKPKKEATSKKEAVPAAAKE